MPRQIKSPDDLYEKHRRMIYKLIHQYAKGGMVDFGDLESWSNEVFAKCYKKWDPRKGAFSTLLYRSLCNAFASELKKGRTRAAYEGDYAHAKVEEAAEDLNGTEWLIEFLRAVDEDARQVVAKLFRHEAQARKRPVSAKDTRDVVKKMLSRMPGWTAARATRAIRELKAALRT
jgi:DNA-directed RNA polymerase specialized sigma24 family protein